MKIAFGIVSLSPSGGLQRECIGVADILRQQGHSVTIFAARRTGEFPGTFDVRILPVSGRTNHGRNIAFARELKRATTGAFDTVVGFDFLPDLDVLYCANPSMGYRVKQRPYLIFPRYRAYVALEEACFRRGSPTRIILLTDRQRDEFEAVWQTEPERVAVLPPTVGPERLQPTKRTDGTRERMRGAFGFNDGQSVWLAVCAQPETKGLDRTIEALRQFEGNHLVVCGLAADDRKARRYVALARKFGVQARISWLGIREDIPDLLAMADVFVHPARYDTTGTTIMEAIINGLPVVTTSPCGYATHVLAAKSGLVLDGDFVFDRFVEALRAMEPPAQRLIYSQAGIRFGEQPWLYQSRTRAAEIIVSVNSDPSQRA